jgi:ABC-type amino acid transport substrate-binding protein
MTARLPLLCIAATLLAVAPLAADAKTVRMAAPGDGKTFEWPVITADRTGLYSRIYDAAFGAAGYKVEQISAPNARCLLMVKTGEADFYPGNLKDLAFEGYTFASPRHAIWYTKGVTLLYRKQTIPDWKGVESLKGKSLVSPRGNNHLKSLEKYGGLIGAELKAASETKDHEAALQMLMAGRADVMVASSEMIVSTLQAMKIKLDDKEYVQQYLDRAKYYPLFRNDQRGRELAAIFDKGIKELQRNGKLAAWFKAEPNTTLENIDPELALP